MNTEEKPKLTVTECTTGIDALIKSGDFQAPKDCAAIIGLLRKACIFKDDSLFADIALMARCEMGAEDGENQEYKNAINKLKQAGVNIEKLRNCLNICPIIREQISNSMAYGSQL